MKLRMVGVFNSIRKLYNHSILVFIFITAVLMNVTIECLGRRSLVQGMAYVVASPLMFLYNTLIICMTMSVCLLIRRRMFTLTLITVFWLTCGIVNCVLLNFRTIPFSAVDLKLLSSAIQIVNVYLSKWQIVLVCLTLLLIVTGMVVLWRKAPKFKGKIYFLQSVSIMVVVAFAVVIISNTKITAENNYPNIADAYENFGFVYCFSNSIIDQGISRPVEYGEEHMDALKTMLENKKSHTKPDVTPNIIMVQLESFFDVKHIKNMEFSEDPVPYFSELKNKYSSGYLTVPSIGAGTANTEFEVITGISLDYFGAGEYPYQTVLKEKTCESICHDLKDYGYTSHALHNNDATFYDRNKVFPNLGFHSFTSIEYMHGVKCNALGWAKDDVLVNEITDRITLTDTMDFVYAITVQAHGKYPHEALEDVPVDVKITSTGEVMSQGLKNATEYYINQIHETDRFISSLVERFQDYDEPTVIVFFGDHLPNLELTNESLSNDNLLQTEYVIWSNFDMPVIRKDMEAFALSAYVAERLGFDGGYIGTYNRYCLEEEDYPSQMQYLAYDMLFGEGYMDCNPQKTKMSMGLRKITVNGVELNDEEYGKSDAIVVNGVNFTECSVVLLNGKKLPTNYISSERLEVYGDRELMDDDVISVAQIGRDNQILSETGGYRISLCTNPE